MKISFELTNEITGKQLHNRFKEAIGEKDIGYEDDFNSSATLSEDGTEWTTAWSHYKYRIVNPDADESAKVLYDGAENGFLKHQLLPTEINEFSLKIVSVEGTYGAWSGEGSLSHYKSIKKNWRDSLTPVYQQLKDSGTFPQDDGHGLSKWLEFQWKFARRIGEFEKVFKAKF